MWASMKGWPGSSEPGDLSRERLIVAWTPKPVEHVDRVGSFYCEDSQEMDPKFIEAAIS